MKSFSEYIAEAYNFRLGGSQRKGFDQLKAFNDLEIGDIVYVCWINEDDRISEKDSCEIYTFSFINKSILILDTRLDFWRRYELNKDALDSSITIISNPNGTHTILGTNLNEVLELIEQNIKVKSDIEIAKRRYEKILEEIEKANESYNFRLGGSQKKGFEQNVPLKKFNELEVNDYYYHWTSALPEEARRVKVLNISYYNDRLRIETKIYGTRSIDFISKESASRTCYWYDSKNIDNETISYVYATSFEEVQDKVKELFNINLTEKSIENETN